jgi:Polyketide cyclase / dehydrase and lipid transport
MWMPEFSIRRVLCALATAVAIGLPAVGLPVVGLPTKPTTTIPHSTIIEHNLDSEKLAAGEVLVDCQEIGGVKYVVAREWLDERVENIWPILVNPYEFKGRICHRLKRVDMLTDLPNVSLMECTVGAIFPIPDFEYKVESHYTARQKVEFHRISGSFKDFRGFWELEPTPNGKTEITYSMHIDPGMPVPDWLVREAVRHELPNVLTGLRDRLNYLKLNAYAAEKHTVAAANRYAAVALEKK